MDTEITETKSEVVATQETPDQEDWLTLARDAYSQGISYMDTNYRKQWENNTRHFRNKHHQGSKYYKESYKYRSKLFRPKTRSAIRSNEAAASAAFHANQDVLRIEPNDPNNLLEEISAEFQQELLQWRLKKSIKWFMISMGAFQLSEVLGVVISHQEWKFKEKEYNYEAEQTDGEGNPVYGEDQKPLKAEVSEMKLLEDKPCVRLVPPENLIIHPAADWVDPINSTPYLIEPIPMYAMDVKAKMKKNGDNKPWKQLSDGELMAATKQRFDSTRQEREGDRTDKFDNKGTGELSKFDIVWVHRNIVRIEDEGDVIFYTAGIDHILSDPIPLEEEYPWCRDGSRPYAMGICVIEALKAYPSGVGELGQDVQKEINENANTRLDAGKFAIQKRWFARRGGQVDLRSMVRNVPGSVTMMGDIEKDVRQVEWNDIPASAYAEQDRLNLDFDDATGSFSSSTVQSNRKLNETVGGMAMIRGETNQVREYTIKTFAETWAEEVIRQLLAMEREYESNEVIMMIAANKSKRLTKAFQAEGIPINPTTLSRLLDFEFSTDINLGMGATDPIGKVNNFRLGLKAITDTIREDAQTNRLDIEEIATEIFGRIGYKDGDRFIVGSEDDMTPREKQLMAAVQQLQQMVQGLQMKLEDNMDELRTKIMIQRMKEEGDTMREILGIRGDIALKQLDHQNQPEKKETVQ